MATGVPMREWEAAGERAIVTAVELLEEARERVDEATRGA